MRFCTVGSGKIVENLLEAAKKVESFKLAAVYSRSRERAEEFATAHGAPLYFSELESAARSADIDAVYIASPNSLHCEQALLFMEHGKHVLCEKPAASNTAELERMLSCAKKNGIVFLEASKHLLAPSLEIIRNTLPKLGTLRRASLVFNQYSSRYDAFKTGERMNTFNPELSNCALMDIGVYCVQLAAALFGRPQSLETKAVFLENGFEGQGFILAQYESFLAELSYSKICQSALPSELCGENGSLLIDSISATQIIEYLPRNGEKETIICETQRNNMNYELERFISFAENGGGQEKFNSISLLSMQLMDEAREKLKIVFPADSAVRE